MQELRTAKEDGQQLGLTVGKITDADDVEGAWLDVRKFSQ